VLISFESTGYHRVAVIDFAGMRVQLLHPV
jgi:hypothetical protein